MIQIMLDPDPFLRKLGDELLASATVLAKPAGATLFRAGQRPSSMFYVQRGEAVMQRVTPRGESLVLQRASGGFIAEASLSSARYHCDGVCLTHCHLLAFQMPALRAAIDTNEAARWAWIDLLGAQARLQRARIERHSLKTIRERLEHLILTEGSGAAGYLGPATKAQLAAELGVSPAALYRCLKVLTDEGRISISGRRLVWLAR
jgi:CRP/FNR family transcriptional regulator, dissimilatory nitrate respiration regulator